VDLGSLHPWNDEQGQSPFVWPVTRSILGTGVKVMRDRGAVLERDAAPGRFVVTIHNDLIMTDTVADACPARRDPPTKNTGEKCPASDTRNTQAVGSIQSRSSGSVLQT
jgi:hypothetical protein